MEKISIIDRVRHALIAFKSADRPDFGQSYAHNSLSDTWRFTGWGWNKWKGGIDYTAEVGALDESSLVMAVVNWTGTQLPEAPPVVQKPGKEGALEPDWGNPVADLIRRPNPFSTWGEECGTLALDWWVGGNWYQKKVRNITGQVVELWYLPSFMVDERWPGDGRAPEVPTSGPNKADNGFLSHYQYGVPGKEPVLFNRNDVVHIKRKKNPANPRKGIGAFDSVIREIYGDNAVATFSATLMKNMGMVPYLLSPKENDVSLGEPEAEAIKEKWLQRTTGANIGMPIVNAIPLEVTKLGFNPQELDLSKLRMIPESRIAAVTGIPAAMLQFMVGLENGTSFAAYREARQQGYESVIIPIQSDIAEQMTWQLLPEFDKTKGARIDFDTSQVRVLQEDRDSLYKRAVDALRNGGTSRNQFMASLGKPPVDKEEIYYVPSMSTPMTAEKIAEVAANMDPAPEPAAIDPASLAKFADLERWFEGLEREMKGFVVTK